MLACHGPSSAFLMVKYFLQQFLISLTILDSGFRFRLPRSVFKRGSRFKEQEIQGALKRSGVQQLESKAL